VAVSLKLGSLIALPLRAQGLRHLCFLNSFPSRTLLSLAPPSTGGGDWASGGTIHHVFTQPFAGDEHPQGMPTPSFSFCCVRWSTPNPNKTICMRISDPVTIYYPLTSISFAMSYAGSTLGCVQSNPNFLYRCVQLV
jgi:hypothetical protein